MFINITNNLVPRGRDPFGQRRGSRPLARSNSGSPRFTDFPSLCACPESSLTNLIGSGLNLLCLQSHSKPECRWTWPGVSISSAWQKEPLGTRLWGMTLIPRWIIRVRRIERFSLERGNYTFAIYVSFGFALLREVWVDKKDLGPVSRKTR